MPVRPPATGAALQRDEISEVERVSPASAGWGSLGQRGDGAPLGLKVGALLVLCATLGWLAWRCTRAACAGRAGYRQTSEALLPCEAWGEEQVLAWLRDDMGLPQLEPTFAQWRIDGSLLLELDHDDLEEMGIKSRLERKRILSSVEKLRASSMASALAACHHKPWRGE